MSVSYADYGYNKFLDREIIRQKKEGYSALDFDGLFEGFLWDKGQGGDVNVGGPNNDLGRIYAKDEQGKKKLVIDKDGLLLVGNTIVTEDSAGVKTTRTLT